MLEYTIKARRPKPATPVYSYTGGSYTSPGQVFYARWADRQKILDTLIKDLKYTKGDKVTPVTEEGKKKYGTACVVTNLLTKYSQFGKDEKWPDTNNPMIVECRTEDGIIFWCTTNYMEKV